MAKRAAGRRSVAGPAHPAGDRRKKAVRPRLRRELAEWAEGPSTEPAPLIPVDPAGFERGHPSGASRQCPQADKPLTSLAVSALPQMIQFISSSGRNSALAAS